MSRNTNSQAVTDQKAAGKFHSLRIYLLLFVFLTLTVITTLVLYNKTQEFFRWSLNERMLALASIASTEFEAEDLNKITGPESIHLNVYKETVIKLQRIRNKTDKLKYIYILRETNNPNELEFVADADSLEPDKPIDLNEDGIVDEEDALTFPGDIYDISEFPEFKEAAFDKSFVDPELTSDQWGTFLSGTSPIIGFSKDGKRYVIGLDLDVSEYLNLTNLALVPFALFVVFLLLILTTLTLILKRLWKTQVKLLAELDIQKDELLSIVSHQLATPVSSIKWYLEMMKDGDLGKLNDEQKAHVTSMQEVAVNLSDLVSMILDVSRIQLGRMHIEKQDLDLSAFFKEILEIIEPKALEKKVNFIKKIPTSFPAAKLDKRYTHMTIENLLSNAVKYTPENGNVDFTVTITGNILRCVVKDTGVGIPKADQEKIFGKLFRASNVRNSVDGNGFGLYVAKGAVEAQGGKIWFESTEGKGTTFFIELPL